MENYYVHKLTDNKGDHEVHVEGCNKMTVSENFKNLGQFSNCRAAVAEAKKNYNQVNGCFYCCNECHTQ